ncbi:Pyrroline-5-carboxylate reductase [Elusimicrobium minutum Pei191]|uniref:Pyrroline-5-carboxylate reductase n=1 Tax=Elusimicrobium minutum (strain Pei191) TaxID=445932 RepID=B2KEI7_ELUMP|nr:pyrroline-5-carboxylate reductase [Elusimicrobium minutum]ACC98933.1 Pyrroline-5-carboxylate reductase [Elusimicrobium minutum Pei191]
MKIIFMGAGKMGHAILSSAIQKKALKKADVVVIKRNTGDLKKEGYKVFNSLSELPSGYLADLIVYTVKPNILEDIIEESKPYLKEDGFVISIAAGKTIKTMQNILGTKTAVVRAMPNLPIAVGYGVTGMYASNQVSKKQKDFCDKIFNSSGISFWLKKEADINKVIGAAGSSPAYIYAVISSLEKVCLGYGFSKELSSKISKYLLLGCAKLMQQTGDSPEVLNKKIATPGGTTEAALNFLAKNKILDKLILKAAKKAETKFPF